jgi:hypothetical protein
MSLYDTDIYRFRCEDRWLMTDGWWPLVVDLSPLPYRQIAFPLHFALSIIINYSPWLSIIIYLSCSSPHKITPEIARHNTPEKNKAKDNQLFQRRESSPLKSRQLWLGKSWIPVSNSMKTRGILMDPYLHMWPASKGVRKGRWQCEAKGQPVLSSQFSTTSG